MDKWAEKPMTIQDALIKGRAALLIEQSDGLRSAEILLQHTLNVSRAYLYTHSDRLLNVEQIIEYQTLIHERQQGIPIAYLTGQRSFWTFDLTVNRHTLIPRPETELLIEQVLKLEPTKRAYAILDLGTGSGAIALALASERPYWQITACDKSAQALLVAQKNADDLHLNSVRFIQSDWFEALENNHFDLIVANPPYLADHDPHLQQGDLRFEPASALKSGHDGLKDLRIIIHDSYDHLNEQGILIVEHGYDQSSAVHDLFTQSGYQAIKTWHDWQGHPRLCCGQKGTLHGKY